MSMCSTGCTAVCLRASMCVCVYFSLNMYHLIISLTFVIAKVQTTKNNDRNEQNEFEIQKKAHIVPATPNEIRVDVTHFHS